MKKYTQEELDQALKDGFRDFRGCDLSEVEITPEHLDGMDTKTGRHLEGIDPKAGRILGSSAFMAFMRGHCKDLGITIKHGNLEKIKNVGPEEGNHP